MSKSKTALKIAVAFLLAIGCLNPSSALETPTKSKLDSRMAYTEYKPGQVYPLNAANGIISTIIFAPGEKVLDYGSGYSTAWEFTARDNHFFLKPKDFNGSTNLVIVTDRHTYLFDVRLLGRRASATYTLTFRYPEDDKKKAEEKAQEEVVKGLLSNSNIPDSVSEPKPEHNRLYSENFGSSALSKDIAPVEALDDGEFTYLKFDKHSDFPAVYRVADDNEETLLNSHVKGPWLVIHGVYKELRLRAGQAVVGIYNDGYTGAGVNNNTGVSVPGLKRELIKEVN